VSEREVETEFVFDRLQAAELSAAYRILVPERPSRSVRAGQEASRADEQRSDLCPGLLGPAEGAGDDPIPDRGASYARRTAGSGVAEQWVFEDDGHSEASLVRPALERLRDLVCQVPVDVLLVYSPGRLARKYAYQALLIEEFAKAGTTVMFIKGPRSDSPEDALLVQFQGMIAEYERAQILERTRRGKAHRAKSGTINVLSGAPFGYRYVRKSEHAEARYEIVAHEAAIVAELFARYADDLLVMCRSRAQGQLFQPGGNCGAQGVDDRGHHGLSTAPIRVGIGGDDPPVDAPGHGDRDVAVVGEHAGQP
jgi:DNA invertase Pin-like site-specific DNA recombinase